MGPLLLDADDLRPGHRIRLNDQTVTVARFVGFVYLDDDSVGIGVETTDGDLIGFPYDQRVELVV